MKLFVTGNAGSGKSTLGKELASCLGVEYFSLDTIVWRERWQKTPPDERQRQISELISRDAWVIDGVSAEVLKSADTVIFLDAPRSVCFYRALKRNSRYLFSSRPEMPERCPEILIIPKLIAIIWRFPKRIRPWILAEKARRADGTFVHITSKKDLKKFLHTF